jgi:polyvinyl alcohol dehydrogenase (cytochrome)
MLIRKKHPGVNRPWLLAGLVPCALLATVLPASAVHATGQSAASGEQTAASTAARGWDTGDSWPMWQYNLYGSRFAPRTPVNPGNVGELTEKWAFTFPRIPGVFPGSQPAVVGGRLYVGSTDAKFYALDATTGATLWSYDLESVAGPATAANPDPVRDGPAVVRNTVYFGDSRGYLFALNARTGTLRWATLLDTTNPDVELTGSPIVYLGLVYIGVSNKEAGYQQQDLNYPCCTARGEEVAVDAETGAVVWRHYTVPPAQAVGTWPSGATEYAPSGVSVWDSPAIDPAAGLLFIGTGQNYTGSTSDADSVLALDLRTGATVWQYQTESTDTYTSICDLPQYASYCPGAATGTAHDWDVSSGPNVFRVGGRTIVGVGNKAGVYTALDALTGKLLWSDPLTPNPGTEGGSSGIEWGTSFDGHSIYVATWDANPGTLYALDPATGAVQWQTAAPADGCSTGGAASQPYCTPGFTPAVTSSPGLVYEGGVDGKLYVFSSATGQILWSYDTVRQFQGVNGVPGYGESVSGIGGAVVANGMVYVQSGYYPFFASNEGTVLLAFGLPD